MSEKIQIKIENQDKGNYLLALKIVDNIKDKYLLKDIYKSMVHRVLRYDKNGLFYLELKYYRKNVFDIILSDRKLRKQSKISKKIENDLLTKFKKKFGKNFVYKRKIN